MHARILEGDQLRHTDKLDEIRAAIAAKKPVWVELDGPSDDANALLRDLNIHPLTIEDIWASRTMPKLEDYDNYLYVIVHAVKSAKQGQVDLVELDVVIGATFVLTHDPSGEITKQVCVELDRTPKLLAKGPAWLAHSLLDHAVDNYLPVVDELDRQLANLEDQTLERAGTRRGPPVLRKILRFKRLLLELRRMSIHQREILLRIARGEFDEIPKDVVPFFRDVYDHFLRINDQIDGYRDLVSGTLDAYLSVQSNRMNEIMKTLTVISTVMLPITFIAGVYGMNFVNMPELHWRWGYPYALTLMALVTLVTLGYFRRKGWIGNKEPELPEDTSGRVAARRALSHDDTPS
ncbi:MAG: magnesium/cobalt transporter CorA [Deltaproteobacteria bacterium]|nr:magnesium/cobalt transporter CorA [Deltaproteobacteria bacterium]